MKAKNNIFAFTSGIVLCCFAAGCNSPEIPSQKLSREINIEENFKELKNTLIRYYYDDNTRTNISVGNDDTYLYVCLLTRNHGLIEKLDSSGFTVWFDPEGGKNKTLGIRLFTGIQGGDIRQPGFVPSAIAKKIEIIGPGKKERYTTTRETAMKYGVTVKTGDLGGYFVYELKIPLDESEQHPYSIGIRKNKIIGLGFESSGPGRGMPPGMGPGGGDMGGGMMRLNLGGGMGRPGGGGPGGGGPGGRGMPGEEGLQLWLRVVLS
jgi:hypothetical protein